MATLDVFNLKREKVGSIDLADEVFAAEVKEHLFYEVVKAQLASRRAGTAGSKNRSAVAGSTRPAARLSPLMSASSCPSLISSTSIPTSGGNMQRTMPTFLVDLKRTHGCNALRAADYPIWGPDDECDILEAFDHVLDALSAVQDRDRIDVLRALLGELDEGVLSALATLKTDRKTMIVDTASNENLRLSIRNSKDHQFLPPEGVNVYDLLRHDTLVLSKDAAKALELRCLDRGAEK